MFVKQVMARPVPTHPKWKYSLNRESMILFFHKKILYGANVVYAEGWQQSKKKNGIFYHISSNPLQNEVSI